MVQRRTENYGLRPARPAIASGPYVFHRGDLFAGFEPELIGRVTDGGAHHFADLPHLDTMVSVERVFLGRAREVRPIREGGIGRSLFVANGEEKARLAHGELLPDDFDHVLFPGQMAFQGDPRYGMLADPRVQVVCVNTLYPNPTVKSWLERAIEPDPHAGKIGVIGLGAIGYHMVQNMVAVNTALLEAGVGTPFTGLNLLADPHPQFPGRRLEILHTANAADLEINVYQPDDIQKFFKQSSIVMCIFSGGIPPLDHKDLAQGDVRMMQFHGNQVLLKQFVLEAERAGFRGTLVVVSDPPEHLATGVVRDNAARVHHDTATRHGLLGNHQVIAEAGLTNFSRAEHFMRELAAGRRSTDGFRFTGDPSGLLDTFRRRGAAFGPHGRGTVIANQVGEGFDLELSDWLSTRVATANYDVRQGHKLPADAPASNLIIALQRMLTGKPVPVSLLVGDVVTGVSATYDPRVGAFSVVPHPEAHPELTARVRDAAHLVASTYEIASRAAPVEMEIACRSSAFWANGVITGERVPTRLKPSCSGRDITNFNAVAMSPHHFARVQGSLYVPSDDPEIAALIKDLLEGYLPHVKHELVQSFHNLPIEPNPAAASTPTNGVQFFEEGAKVGRLVVDHDPFPTGKGKIHLPLYRREHSLFLQVDVAIDSPQNIELIGMLRKQGALLLGFTPRMHNQPPRLHFGFIGENVEIDSEFPVTPLASSLEGHEGAKRVFAHWITTFGAIRKSVGTDKCAPTYREKAVEKGRAMIERDPLLKGALIEDALYDEVPRRTLYEHILDVTEVLQSLVKILNVKGLDGKMLHRLVAMHDLGKAVYLLLNHYKNAVRLQRSHMHDGAVQPLGDAEVGPANGHWRYGRYMEDLRKGRPIEMPEFLKPYERFVDVDTDWLARDVEIAKAIVEESSVFGPEQDLKGRLLTFFDADEALETCDATTLLIELADNLSDYGRLENAYDIGYYLDVKERYVLARYGRDDESRASISRKFANLRRHTADLFEAGGNA